jgi:hypothetical protein
MIFRRSYLIILWLALFRPQSSLSQSISTLMGGRAAGLGYASSTLGDEWAMLNNVGGLSKIEKLNAAFGYDTRPKLSGSNRMAAVLSMPVKIGAAGLSLFRFGDELYSEEIVSAGYSNQFGITSLGLTINYVQYRAEGIGTRSFVGINFGGITQLSKQFSIGAYVVNLNQPKLSSIDDERAPTRLVVGVSFQASEECLIISEVEKELSFDPTIKAGVEYVIYKKVFARTGFNLQPSSAFFGLGFKTKRIKFDYALQYNHTLSAAHQASAIYFIEKKKPKNDP